MKYRRHLLSYAIISSCTISFTVAASFRNQLGWNYHSLWSPLRDGSTEAMQRKHTTGQETQAEEHQTKTSNQKLLPSTMTCKNRSILIQEAKYDPTPENNYHDIEDYTPKRSNYISWQPYFLAIAKLTSQRSKDPSNQVGACIVDENNRILGIGYNGFPRGCSDDILPWSSSSGTTSNNKDDKNGNTNEQNDLHSKEYYMVQAEINAILNKIGNITSSTMYVYGSFPDNDCAKIIIQAGIREVVYMDMSRNKTSSQDHENKMKASRILFGLAGVELTNYTEVLHRNEDGSRMIPIIPDLNFDSFHNQGETNNNKLITETESSTRISEKDRQLLIEEANYDPIQQKETTSNSNPNNKRKDYLSWDDYFTAVASLSAYRSKDPNTQVGACIVDSNKCIIGIGYNGFPRGCSDDHLPWSRRASNTLHTKYLYVVHAEVNAILNKGTKDCTGATLYVALFPCNECAKVIIQSGIKEVVYLSDTYHDTDICKASRILFEMAGVKCRQYFPSTKNINVDILNREGDDNEK